MLSGWLVTWQQQKWSKSLANMTKDAQSSSDDVVKQGLDSGKYIRLCSCQLIKLQACWMSCNFLLLNSDKTEAIVFRPQNLRDMLSSHIVTLDDIALALCTVLLLFSTMIFPLPCK